MANYSCWTLMTVPTWAKVKQFHVITESVTVNRTQQWLHFKETKRRNCGARFSWAIEKKTTHWLFGDTKGSYLFLKTHKCRVQRLLPCMYTQLCTLVLQALLANNPLGKEQAVVLGSHHRLQPRAEGGGQAGQQLHGSLRLVLAVEKRVAQPLTCQHQQLGAQNILIFHL